MRNIFQASIRQEMDSDVDVIHSITEDAFRGRPYAGGDEQIIIDRLRKLGKLTLSLAALLDDTVVGHIAFSPVSTSDDSQGWFALGPVSVLPKYQRNGIGSKLIREGLAQIEKQGALGCVLTGNPKFYRKFDFELAPASAPSDEERDYFMMRCFTNFEPNGPIFFDSAFYGDV